MSTSAKVIAHSSFQGREAATIEGRLHRWVLAELNTHRIISRPQADAPFYMEEFSRNSASSRAIPVSKQILRVQTDPAFPVAWPEEQKGMQGGQPLSDVDQLVVEGEWDRLAGTAARAAAKMTKVGLHKSVTNRVLEPWMWHTVVLTATNWQGFFDQRLDKNAQPEIRVFAEALKEALDASTPRELAHNQWHLPYIEREDITAVEEWLLENKGQGNYGSYSVTEQLVHISTARCARTSYLTQDGKRDITEDMDLYERLVSASPVHYSPAEHVCTPDLRNEVVTRIYPRFGNPAEQLVEGVRLHGGGYEYVGPRYGNLTGFHQHRFDLMAKAAHA